LEDVEDIPIPSQDRENGSDDSREEDSDTGRTEETAGEGGPALTITYAFGDMDSLLYVQVWKEESAWGSGLASGWE
jgi:hypothetical protein